MIGLLWYLKGISEAIKLSFPKSEIQKCVVHQIRNSIKYVLSKEISEFVSDMKKIYKTSSYDNALIAFDNFTNKWESKYPTSVKSWRNNFDELTTFFNYPLKIRKIIYTTNTIENVNRNIRKIIKTKSVFSTQTALVKLVYLRQADIQEDWEKR